jgi:hypothetical protein
LAGFQVIVHTRITGEGLDMDMLELWTLRADFIVACQPFYFDAGLAARTAREAL